MQSGSARMRNLCLDERPASRPTVQVADRHGDGSARRLGLRFDATPNAVLRCFIRSKVRPELSNMALCKVLTSNALIDGPAILTIEAAPSKTLKPQARFVQHSELEGLPVERIGFTAAKRLLWLPTPLNKRLGSISL